MNASVIALIGIIWFVFIYRFYSRFIEKKVFELDKIKNEPPSVELEDGIDFVPTKKNILFGHHFSSIAGAAPIVGPAVAVMWGWLPAVLWIFFGVTFMGAVHDFGALVLSMKHQGGSIAQVAEKVLGERAKTLFLIVIFFLVWMVIAVFALVIANLFIKFPGSVIPVNFEIIIAIIMGVFINKRKGSLTIPSLLAQITLMLMIVLGTYYPISLAPIFGEHALIAWMLSLIHI